MVITGIVTSLDPIRNSCASSDAMQLSTRNMIMVDGRWSMVDGRRLASRVSHLVSLSYLSRVIKSNETPFHLLTESPSESV
jgi:hypothetical protein